MKIFALSFLLLMFVGVMAFSQTVPADNYRVYDAKGNPSSLAAILKALDGVDVVFLGEQHDDAVCHGLEFEIFQQAVADYAAKRKVALSMEMFERDVQIVVNEYLSGQITEAQFLASSRPWGNYKTDYRPLVELAKEKKLPVIAANAPRRYVNMVSRGGRDALNGLTKEAKAWIAPLPYGEPSATYANKFKALMGPSPEAQMGIDKILSSQSLWDATMSNSVANYLKKNKGALVVHLNGAFHTESRLGTVEHLLKYRPKTKVLVVTMRYEDDFKTFDKAKDTDIGDFVVLTAPKGKTAEILHRMDVHNQALTSMRADVTMVQYNEQLNVSDTSIASVNYLAKTPKRRMYIRLDWTKPVQEQIAVIGEDYELYRPRLNQVFAGKVGSSATNAAVGGALSFMKMSLAELKENYAVAYSGTDTISGGVKTWHLEVTPKIPTIYKTAELWVDADGMPRQAKVTEKNGDTTTVLLSSIIKNLTIKGDAFKLSYPSTVKRIRS